MRLEDVLDYLESQNVDVANYRHTANHLILRECPFCSKPTNGRMDNLFKCYIMINTSNPAFKCHRCGEGGSWYALKQRLSGFAVDDVAQVRAGGSQAPPSNSSRPSARAMSTASAGGWTNFSISHKADPLTVSNNRPSRPSPPVTRPLDFSKRGYESYLKTPNFNRTSGQPVPPLPMPAHRLQALYSTELLDTTKSSPVRDYLQNERGLTVKTLRVYGVGQASYRFANAENKWVASPSVTFPWMMRISQIEKQETLRGSTFKRTGEPKKEGQAEIEDEFIARRIKVRSVEEKSWQRLEPTGGGWGLFGWHTIPLDAKEVVITEGEYDAMAVYQATGRPSISLPNGCRSLPVEVLPLLEGMEKIYLWMDNDAAGQEGAENFAKKFGLERTYLVRPTPSNLVRLTVQEVDSKPIQPPKDANEALLAGLDLNRIIEDAKLVPHEKIMTFHDLRSEVFQEITFPDKFKGTPIKSLPGLTAIMQGLRRGEMTVLTGPTGAGKTTFLGQLSIDLAESGTNLLWGSFEIKNTRLMHKLMQQFAREPLPKGDLSLEDKLHAIADRFEQLPLYFMTFHGGSDVDQVIEAMDYAVYVYDVEHIILDNMQFMVSKKNMTRTFDKFDVQDVAIEKFRQFATERNVHITLVVHPRKEAENERLSMASIYGSAKATQEADTVLILQYDGQKKWIEVKKNRFSGELGKCDLYFDRQSQRYSNEPIAPGAGGYAPSAPSQPAPPRQPQRPRKDPPPSPENTDNFWNLQFGTIAQSSTDVDRQ